MPEQSRRRALLFGLISIFLPTARSFPASGTREAVAAARPDVSTRCPGRNLLTQPRRDLSPRHHEKIRRDAWRSSSSRSTGAVCCFFSKNNNFLPKAHRAAAVPTAIAASRSRSARDPSRNGGRESENGIGDRDRVRRPRIVPPVRPAFAALTSLLRFKPEKLFARVRGGIGAGHRTDPREDPLNRVRLLRHLPLRLACLVLGTYLSIGAVAYKCVFREASWSVLDALYFSSACLSTIGYGDLVPSTTGGKAFAVLYGMSGILAWSSAVATVGARLVHSETIRATASADRCEDDAADRERPKTPRGGADEKGTRAGNGEVMEDTPSSPLSSSSTSPSRSPVRKQRTRNDSRSQLKLLARSLAKPLLLIFVGGTVIGGFEGWVLSDSIYFSLVTATTIGFGDLCPATQRGRLATVVLVPLLLAAAGDFFASLGVFVVRQRTRGLFATPRERAEWLTPEQATAMDATNDGRVSKPEFVLYMLEETGCISRDDFGLFEDRFERFDVTRSGYIEAGDLEAMKAIRDGGPRDPSP